ncbi:M48 family metalloprotease [Phenylobacterium sp.]|uniref:M48 family metalloprotease n=1 Tax=Phenylobacterium sp. TaxID=1871053 RepID=UPI002DF4C8F5|nr:M48 family metalloprotease [Phenylobacterium sp.]
MSWHDSLIHLAGNEVFDGPFQNLWPLVAAPALAAWISDRTARLLPRTPASAWPAAALTAAPGVVGLGAIVQALQEAPQWNKVLTWHGVMNFWVTPAIAAGLLLFALWRGWRRQAEVARLFALSSPPGARLAGHAARLGLRALQIPTREKECFVAGLLRPTVFVSDGALDQLGEAELEAALSHERAHVTGRDTLFLMLLSFLRDLAPWGRGLALEAFRVAREARADSRAAAAAGPLNLAAALLALARPGAGPAAVLPMARNDSLRWRMQALLDAAPAPAGSLGMRAGLLIGLAASGLLTFWPAAQVELMFLFCANT